MTTRIPFEVHSLAIDILKGQGNTLMTMAEAVDRAKAILAAPKPPAAGSWWKVDGLLCQVQTTRPGFVVVTFWASSRTKALTTAEFAGAVQTAR